MSVVDVIRGRCPTTGTAKISTSLDNSVKSTVKKIKIRRGNSQPRLNEPVDVVESSKGLAPFSGRRCHPGPPVDMTWWSHSFKETAFICFAIWIGGTQNWAVFSPPMSFQQCNNAAVWRGCAVVWVILWEHWSDVLNWVFKSYLGVRCSCKSLSPRSCTLNLLSPLFK